MCITAPGRVIALDAGGAVVETGGVHRRASTLVVPDVAVGDWVMVGAGSILRRLDPASAVGLVRTIETAIGKSEPAATTEGDPP